MSLDRRHGRRKGYLWRDVTGVPVVVTIAAGIVAFWAVVLVALRVFA